MTDRSVRGPQTRESVTMLVAGRLVEGGERVRVTIDKARIASIDVVDRAPDVWIASGFVDIQVNG